MEQNNVAVDAANIAPTPAKFPTWAVMLIILLFLITIGLIAAIAFVLFQAANQTQVTPPPIVMLPETMPPAQTPTSADPTASWKTYNNEELGISFKHPTDWGVKFIAPAEGEGYAGASTANMQIGDIMFIKRNRAKDDFLATTEFGQTKVNPSEMPTVVINGTIYKFTKSTFGEGHGVEGMDCAEGGTQHSYYFEVNGEVVIIQSSETLSCGADGEQLTTKTKTEDLETARLIADSISFSE